MFEIKRGMIVKSLAGHDKTKLYVILDVKAEYVYLTDGKLKTVDNPKKKRIKHVQPTLYVDKFIQETNSDQISDSDIRKVIKQYIAEQE